MCEMPRTAAQWIKPTQTVVDPIHGKTLIGFFDPVLINGDGHDVVYEWDEIKSSRGHASFS